MIEIEMRTAKRKNHMQVTENDFRKDEFKDKDPKDYEFRKDGVIVRKDRWEMGMRIIASILVEGDYEIDDIIQMVRDLKIKDKENK